MPKGLMRIMIVEREKTTILKEIRKEFGTKFSRWVRRKHMRGIHIFACGGAGQRVEKVKQEFHC